MDDKVFRLLAVADHVVEMLAFRIRNKFVAMVGNHSPIVEFADLEFAVVRHGTVEDGPQGRGHV